MPCSLTLQEILVVRDHNRSLPSEGRLGGAVGQATGWALPGQGRELFQRHRQ